MIRIEEELVVNNKTIDARILSRMFLAGAKNLEAKKEWINELNVFPVPDGDTGTNMTMTIMAAASLATVRIVPSFGFMTALYAVSTPFSMAAAMSMASSSLLFLTLLVKPRRS